MANIVITLFMTLGMLGAFLVTFIAVLRWLRHPEDPHIVLHWPKLRRR